METRVSRIADDLLATIRARVDLVVTVSRYVSLTKRGRDYWGCCPFHQEDTPSFKVNPLLGLFHCFGCGAGGNIYRFVMEMEGLSFVEAVKELAKEAGVELPESYRQARPAGAPDAVSPETLYQLNQFAAGYFHRQLLGQEGQDGLQYLKQRGFSEAEAAVCQLGFGGEADDGLSAALAKAGLPLAAAAQLGLVAPSTRSSGYYDRFRRRLVFPITDVRGRILGFGARIFADDDQQAKYINSSESPLYHKSRVLFGLREARPLFSRANLAYLVEGYFDCLRAVQAGVVPVVATCGTALTEDQTRMLKRYVPRVVLMYDGDEAGRKATRRATELCLRAGLEVFAALLPAGEDPDSLVQKRGPESLQEVARQAGSAVALYLDQAAPSSLRNAPPEERGRAVAQLQDLFAALPKGIARDLYLQQLSERVGLPESSLHRYLSPHAGAAPRPSPLPAKPAAARLGKIPDLLAAALLCPAETAKLLFPEDIGIIKNDEARQLLLDWLAEIQKTGEPDGVVFLSRITSPALRQAIVARMEALTGTAGRPPGEALRDTIFELQRVRLLSELKKQRLGQRQTEEGSEELHQHQQKISEINRRLKELEEKHRTAQIARGVS